MYIYITIRWVIADEDSARISYHLSRITKTKNTTDKWLTIQPFSHLSLSYEHFTALHKIAQALRAYVFFIVDNCYYLQQNR